MRCVCKDEEAPVERTLEDKLLRNVNQSKLPRAQRQIGAIDLAVTAKVMRTIVLYSCSCCTQAVANLTAPDRTVFGMIPSQAVRPAAHELRASERGAGGRGAGAEQ